MIELSPTSGTQHGVADESRVNCRIAFVTAIPQNVQQGSGCYVGIRTLANGIRALGGQVEMITPIAHFPFLPAERYLFNQALRLRREWTCDAIVGFDLDGFALNPRRRLYGAELRPDRDTCCLIFRVPVLAGSVGVDQRGRHVYCDVYKALWRSKMEIPGI